MLTAYLPTYFRLPFAFGTYLSRLPDTDSWASLLTFWGTVRQVDWVRDAFSRVVAVGKSRQPVPTDELIHHPISPHEHPSSQ